MSNPDSEHTLYEAGILARIEKEGGTIEEAAQYYIADAISVKGEEHVPLIEAAARNLQQGGSNN